MASAINTSLCQPILWLVVKLDYIVVDHD